MSDWGSPGPSFADALSDNLVCNWTNRSGRCGEEVDFIITFGAAPCGHEQDRGQIMRLCVRHTLRAMFVMLTSYVCAECGRVYKGISLLRLVERL